MKEQHNPKILPDQDWYFSFIFKRSQSLCTLSIFLL